MKMKFNVELVSKSSGRLGVIQRMEKGAMRTPALMMATKSGSLPYISREVFDLIMPASEQSSQLLGINIQSTLEMSESLKHFSKGISAFVGLSHIPALVHLNDYSVTAKLQHNEANGIPVFAKSGKKVLTPKSFIDVLESFNPEAAVLLGDTNLSLDVGKNRSRKSVNKTMEFMDKCLELRAASERLKEMFLLAPIVGSAKEHDRKELLEFINKKEEIEGYSIEGLHKMGPDAVLADEGAILDTIKILLQNLKQDKLRLTLGAYSPLMVIDLIIAGVDVFDNTLALLYAESQNALVFNFNAGKPERNSEGLHISVVGDSIKENFQPILDGCSCLTCKKHTLAYVRHLFDAKELLGSILLVIHNFHHYNEFFKVIRQHVQDDSLLKLREIIAAQCKLEDFQEVFKNAAGGNANKSDGMVIAKD